MMFLLDSDDMTRHDCRERTVPRISTILGGIAAVSAALLMTELALTRIFSVTMYALHFAFLRYQSRSSA